MEERSGERRLAELLLAPHDDAACAACLDGLEEYVAAQLAGGPYAARFPALASHLDSCVACAEAYALIYADLAAAAPAPARIPAPNLSFLGAGPTLGELLASALERVGAGLRLRLSMPLLAAAAQAPALAYRDAAGPLLDLTVDSPAPDVEQLQLTAYRRADDPSHCDLRVRVALPGRDWPDLAGVTVRVVTPTATLELRTDAWGEAVATLPVAELDQLAVELLP